MERLKIYGELERQREIYGETERDGKTERDGETKRNGKTERDGEMKRLGERWRAATYKLYKRQCPLDRNMQCGYSTTVLQIFYNSASDILQQCFRYSTAKIPLSK